MASKVTAPAASATPAPSITARASQELASAKTGHDPLRPFRYAKTFVGGSLTDGLNDMAHYGRKGLWVGMGLGMIAAIALSSLVVPLVVGAALGFGLGVVGGGAKGVLTGGFKAVGRLHRGEVYAEDLVQRQKVQTMAPPPRADYRAAYAAQQHRNAYITQQVLERNNENTKDFNTYWRDLVTNPSADKSRGI